MGILLQEPELNADKSVLGNVEEGVADTKAMLARFEQVSIEMADPDANFDALMAEMGSLQEELDRRNAWDLDAQLEQAMDALPEGGLSDPVVSRFGVHLIEVDQRREVPVDPRVLREQARNVLRGEKFESAYAEWVRELRSRAYVELRDAPL